MSYKKNESQITDLQLVEIDQNKFAVQLTDGNINVNLSKMALPYGSSKRPANWLRSKESKEYLDALSVAQKRATADLLQVRQGGTPDEQGTWANDYRIAMRFAQWLSPAFAIKVDEMLVNLLLNRSKPETKQIPAQASTYQEETLITVKMGQYTNQIYITGGVIYARLSPIMKYLGYQNNGGQLVDKMGRDNCKQILVGKWFINVAAFDRLLNLSTYMNIQSSVMSAIYRDVFRVGRPLDDYVYHYTAMQMLEIFELIMTAPINKDKVINRLSKGKI